MSDWADVFFTWLWKASWQASLVIVLVALTQVLLPKRVSARWRHGLWLLVLVRLILPWSPETRLSLYNWVRPGAHSIVLEKVSGFQAEGSSQIGAAGETATQVAPHAQWQVAVRWIWLAGAGIVLGQLLWTSWRLDRAVRGIRPVTGSAALNLLEDCKHEMNVSTPITLLESDVIGSPSLLGFVRPRLLLPEGFTRNFSSAELRHVFLHELGHVRRGDIVLNWVMSLALVAHWFNPLVWYAFSRLRSDRELACDALALAGASERECQSYGRTIIKVLEQFSRPAGAPGLLGILETKHQIKRRIAMIAKLRGTRNWTIAATSIVATLALITLTDAQSSKEPNGKQETEQGKSEGPPRIVATSPKVGETDVSPSLTEITVTFDRDMGKGFSWTGSGPDYPPLQEGKKPQWRDARTCVLPVKLQAGHYYRVGINSTSYQNFRSADGEPARTSAVYFTTQGASDELKRKASKPTIIGLEPKNGTKDVDPGLKELRVTFSVPMGDGFSWTGGGPQFPTIPEGKKPFWTDDHKTCILPVELKPGSEYRLGLNSPSHKNFQSSGGVPLEPISYTFSTK